MSTRVDGRHRPPAVQSLALSFLFDQPPCRRISPRNVLAISDSFVPVLQDSTQGRETPTPLYSSGFTAIDRRRARDLERNGELKFEPLSFLLRASKNPCRLDEALPAQT